METARYYRISANSGPVFEAGLTEESPQALTMVVSVYVCFSDARFRGHAQIRIPRFNRQSGI